MRLLVIGDVHAASERVDWRDLLSRRVLAVANHRLRRGKHFDPGLLAGIVERMGGIEADGLICTGDLTTTALAEEFDSVRAALEPARAAVVGRGGRAWVVPGNHDRYTFASTRERRLEGAMTGWEPSRGSPAFEELTDAWSMLLLDSASPNVATSRGRLSVSQKLALQAAVDGLNGKKGLVVVCHYPPAVPEGVKDGGGRRLIDRDDMAEMVRGARGRVVWLHGHVHEPWWWPWEEDAVRGEALAGGGAIVAEGPGVATLNAGSPCWVDGRWPRGQGFWELELGVGEGGATVRAVHHG
ncbi:MAG: metallophosphoesterase [Planctomycetota bacterium]